VYEYEAFTVKATGDSELSEEMCLIAEDGYRLVQVIQPTTDHYGVLIFERETE